MSSPEVIAALFAGSIDYHAVHGSFSNSAELTRSELAGLLAGLDRHAVDYAFARYGCDTDSERRLIAHVRVWLAGIAIRERWDGEIVKSRPTLCNMSALAVFESVRPNRCDRCYGRGILVNRACNRCGGSGYNALSGRKIAGAIGVPETSWRATWADRYKKTFNYVQDIDSKVIITLRKATKRIESFA